MMNVMKKVMRSKKKEEKRENKMDGAKTKTTTTKESLVRV